MSLPNTKDMIFCLCAQLLLGLSVTGYCKPSKLSGLSRSCSSQ